MSIGVDFILRAKSASFTQGLAAANTAIKDLKKSAREFDIGNGLKQALGVGGIIAGFRSAINNAQELRDEAQKTGRAIDDSVRSVAAYGDALDKAWKGTKDLTTTTLSFFTRAGEGWGMLINRMRGVTAEQEKIAEGAARGADAQEKARDALRAKLADRAKTIDKDIAEQEKKNSDIGLTTEQRRNKLLEERTRLLDEIDSMPTREGAEDVARKEKILRATALTGEIKKLGEELFADFEKEDIKQYEKQQKAEKELINKFAPTVEELAKQSTGGFVEGNDPRLQARKIVGLEQKAQTLFGRGDYKGGLAAATQAQQMRQNLEGQTSGSGVLTPKAAEDAFTNALKTTNAKIEDLEKAIGGIIKAQP